MSDVVGERFGIATIESAEGSVPAVVTDLGVVALGDLVRAGAPSSVRGMIGDWDEWYDRIADVLATPGADPVWTAPGDVVFAAPLPDPANSYLAGAKLLRPHPRDEGTHPG